MPRMDRVNQQIKREISLIIHRELQDPRLQFVTILSVEVSRDLRHAKVHFSVLGDNEKIRQGEDGLARARGLIRKLVGDRISMRNTPELDFIYDDSVLYSAFIDETLQEIKNESSEDNSDHKEK